MSECEQVIASINRTIGDTWANFDRPIDVRTTAGTLAGFKKMLVKQWGYNSGCVKYDPDAGTLSVANKEVLKVKVTDFELILQWTDGEWESWEALQSSEELSSIKSSAKINLQKAKEFTTSKGKGKQPH